MGPRPVRPRRLDRTSQFAVIAAEEAWKDSGLDGVELDKDRLGVAIASGIEWLTAKNSPSNGPSRTCCPSVTVSVYGAIRRSCSLAANRARETC